MNRSIDLRRPQELTIEQSFSVNEHPRVRFLIKHRDKLKSRLKGKATPNPIYKDLNRTIINERQRQRHALLKEVQEKWHKKQPVIDIERQLSGLKFSDDVKVTLESSDDKVPEQKRLIEVILTLPDMSLKEELRRRNAAINTVIDYCRIEEGGVYRPNRHYRWSKRSVAPAEVKTGEDVQFSETAEALKKAMSSVYEEKRPRICFVCLGNERLPINKRVYEFWTPDDLTRQFR